MSRLFILQHPESPESRDALYYVANTYLNHPYTDWSVPRRYYILPPGKYNQYVETPHEEIVGAIYRPNHGSAHNLRVASKVSSMVDFYVTGFENKNPEIHRLFQQFQHPNEIQKLEIVSAFYVARRESEAVFSADPQSPYQRYRHASSEVFLNYAHALNNKSGQLLFSPDEVTLYSAILANPDYDHATDRELLIGTNPIEAKRVAIKAIISSCHALDLARCFPADHMNKKMREITAPLGNVDAQDQKHAHQLFVESEKALLLTGDKLTSKYDKTKKEFQTTKTLFRFALFQIASMNIDIEIRLIQLSQCIDSIEHANALAIVLNREAIKGKPFLEAKLAEIDTALNFNEKITAILQQAEIDNHDITQGRIFKAIRNDTDCFWENFTNSLTNPQHPNSRGELRKGDRLPYTVRLSANTQQPHYECVSTYKHSPHRTSLHGAKKTQYVRHQSTTYCNSSVGYLPPFFGYNTDRAGVLVGVSFAPSHCIFNRILIYDGGTVNRPYDFADEEQAQDFIWKQINSGMYQTSLNALQARCLVKNEEQINEVMAGFQWSDDGTSHITIFSDNLESRMLAQLRALDLHQRFLEKNIFYPIPISFYPDFSLYTDEAKYQDFLHAESEFDLKKYTLALYFMQFENAESDFGALPIQMMIDTYLLLEKISGKKTDQFYKRVLQKQIDQVVEEFKSKCTNSVITSRLDPSKIPNLTHLGVQPFQEITIIDFLNTLVERKEKNASADPIELIRTSNEFALYVKCVTQTEKERALQNINIDLFFSPGQCVALMRAFSQSEQNIFYKRIEQKLTAFCESNNTCLPLILPHLYHAHLICFLDYLKKSDYIPNSKTTLDILMSHQDARYPSRAERFLQIFKDKIATAAITPADLIVFCSSLHHDIIPQLLACFKPADFTRIVHFASDDDVVDFVVDMSVSAKNSSLIVSDYLFLRMKDSVANKINSFSMIHSILDRLAKKEWLEKLEKRAIMFHHVHDLIITSMNHCTQNPCDVINIFNLVFSCTRDMSQTIAKKMINMHNRNASQSQLAAWSIADVIHFFKSRKFVYLTDQQKNDLITIFSEKISKAIQNKTIEEYNFGCFTDNVGIKQCEIILTLLKKESASVTHLYPFFVRKLALELAALFHDLSPLPQTQTTFTQCELHLAWALHFQIQKNVKNFTELQAIIADMQQKIVDAETKFNVPQSGLFRLIHSTKLKDYLTECKNKIKPYVAEPLVSRSCDESCTLTA